MSFQLVFMQNTYYGKDGIKNDSSAFFFPRENICTVKFEYRFLLERNVGLCYFLNLLQFLSIQVFRKNNQIFNSLPLSFPNMTFHLELIVIKYDAMHLFLACIFLKGMVLFVLNLTGTKYSTFPEKHHFTQSLQLHRMVRGNMQKAFKYLSQWVRARAS